MCQTSYNCVNSKPCYNKLYTFLIISNVFNKVVERKEVILMSGTSLYVQGICDMSLTLQDGIDKRYVMFFTFSN